MTDLAQLENEILADVAAAPDDAALEAVRVAVLGKNGTITGLLKTLGSLAPEQRKSQGALINGMRDRVNTALAERRDAFKAAALEARLNTESVDVTLPVREAPAEIGRVHPITQVIDELTAIFADMGFAVAEGPDIETDDYNFTKLNFPEEHPARAMHDTFYFPDGRLLRTHTSPVQIRAMLEHGAPIALIAPGRVYRCDYDMTHSPMFHQLEGLVVDERISFANMKAALHGFLQAYFERDLAMRLRPSYFPFTEPSAEVDMSCVFCEGRGCKVCKQTGWLEISGCGMVHPAVLKASGVDPERYSGYAFGMGIDRLAMLRYGLNDLRLAFENDLRFLRQFRAF